MASNNNNKQAFNAQAIAQQSFKRVSGGGKRQPTVVGLWQDKEGGNQHIKTRILGVGDGEAFSVAIQGGRIVLTVMSDTQAAQVVKSGGSVFKSAPDGKGKGGAVKYQSYAVVSGLGSDTWGKMCELVWQAVGSKHKTIDDLRAGVKTTEGNKIKSVFKVVRV